MPTLANIVYHVVLRPGPVLHIIDNRIEQEDDPVRSQNAQCRDCGVYNVDSVDVTVSRDLFQENIGITRVSNVASREGYLHGTKATARFSSISLIWLIATYICLTEALVRSA